MVYTSVYICLTVTEVHWVAVHAGNTAAVPASEVEAIIWSPTNMATVDGGVISRYASTARPSCNLNWSFRMCVDVIKHRVYFVKMCCCSKGRDLYEKNVAPLLHLAGLEVTLVKVCVCWMNWLMFIIIRLTCQCLSNVSDICVINITSDSILLLLTPTPPSSCQWLLYRWTFPSSIVSEEYLWEKWQTIFTCDTISWRGWPSG